MQQDDQEASGTTTGSIVSLSWRKKHDPFFFLVFWRLIVTGGFACFVAMFFVLWLVHLDPKDVDHGEAPGTLQGFLQLLLVGLLPSVIILLGMVWRKPWSLFTAIAHDVSLMALLVWWATQLSQFDRNDALGAGVTYLFYFVILSVEVFYIFVRAKHLRNYKSVPQLKLEGDSK